MIVIRIVLTEDTVDMLAATIMSVFGELGLHWAYLNQNWEELLYEIRN